MRRISVQAPQVELRTHLVVRSTQNDELSHQDQMTQGGSLNMTIEVINRNSTSEKLG